jgi:putative transposase
MLVNRRITSLDVIEQLYDLFLIRGVPEYIRSDNGPEFTTKAIRNWLNRVGVKTLFIEPGSPWENGYIESFNGKLRDELLNYEIFTTLTEAKVFLSTMGGQAFPTFTGSSEPRCPKTRVPT